MKNHLKTILIAAVALACTSLGASALTFQGITFSLTDLGGGELQVTFSPATGNSIKASASGDWTGIQFLEAFSLVPSGGTFTGASLAGWTEVNGGLSNGSSTGCDGNGAGVCFTKGASPFAIPATGNMVFDAFFTGGTAVFEPTTHLKVDFFTTADQTKSTGDLLSQDIPVTGVPGPIVGAGLPGLLAACGGLLALARRRRQRLA
jgi:hypothetical protein